MMPGILRMRASLAVPDRREKARLRIVSLIFIIYWLLIFEGALRKWAFPEFEKILFFIRDPFVLLVYWFAFRNRFFPKKSWLLIGAILLGVLMTPVIVIQTMTLNLNPLIMFYGWRNYFFYVPLAFVIGECFKTTDLVRMVRQSLIVAIPMAVLVYFQFLSPPDSFINKAVTKDAFIFKVSGDIVRTTGTFTFTAGHSLFVGSIVAMLMIVWLIPAGSRPIKRTVLWLATGAAATMIALSGSRTVFFLVALSLLGLITAGMLIHRLRARAIWIPAMLSVIGAVIFIFAFPTAFEAMSQRQADAAMQEGSTVTRAFSSFYNFVDVLPEAPNIGYGLGFGTGGGSSLATGLAQFTLAEDEWSRIILEIGPFLGFLYILFRVALVSSLLLRSIKEARNANNPLPLILLSFIGMPLLNGPITMQGTINGYGWIFCGFCLAAIKTSQVATVNKSAAKSILTQNTINSWASRIQGVK